jgi:hypothetical protein
MKRFESIEEVAEALGNGGPFNPDVNYEKVEELVDALINLGNTDKVFFRHDDHLGLKCELSLDFLNSQLAEIEKPEFESDIEAVLEQADRIISLSLRELSEDDIDEIREDKASRGEDPDD